MVSGKIWTGYSIKLENKPYQYGLTGNIRGEPKLETTGNTNNKTLKLVPLPSGGVRLNVRKGREGFIRLIGRRLNPSLPSPRRESHVPPALSNTRTVKPNA